jgi:hypothetical protein
MQFSQQLFEPLPPVPSLELSPEAFQTAVESISLAIMGRCRGSCMGEKVPFLLSQVRSLIYLLPTTYLSGMVWYGMVWYGIE